MKKVVLSCPVQPDLQSGWGIVCGFAIRDSNVYYIIKSCIAISGIANPCKKEEGVSKGNIRVIPSVVGESVFMIINNLDLAMADFQFSTSLRFGRNDVQEYFRDNLDEGCKLNDEGKNSKFCILILLLFNYRCKNDYVCMELQIIWRSLTQFNIYSSLITNSALLPPSFLRTYHSDLVRTWYGANPAQTPAGDEECTTKGSHFPRPSIQPDLPAGG